MHLAPARRRHVGRGVTLCGKWRVHFEGEDFPKVFWQRLKAREVFSWLKRKTSTVTSDFGDRGKLDGVVEGFPGFWVILENFDRLDGSSRNELVVDFEVTYFHTLLLH